MTTTIYLVRHGEVHNPEQIIYGRLPGFGLSTKGREQVEAAATALEKLKPFDVLYSSPLQRAQESAALLTARLQMPILEDELLAETEIGGYQGKSFDALPKPYLTEEGVAGIEGASSMRARFLAWATEAGASEALVVTSVEDELKRIQFEAIGFRSDGAGDEIDIGGRWVGTIRLKRRL